MGGTQGRETQEREAPSYHRNEKEGIGEEDGHIEEGSIILAGSLERSPS